MGVFYVQRFAVLLFKQSTQAREIEVHRGTCRSIVFLSEQSSSISFDSAHSSQVHHYYIHGEISYIFTLSSSAEIIRGSSHVLKATMSVPVGKTFTGSRYNVKTGGRLIGCITMVKDFPETEESIVDSKTFSFAT